MSIEHPSITKMERDGFLEEDIKSTDYFGNPIECGEDIVVDEDGDFVHKDYLQEFLEKKYGFEFKEFGD